MNLQALEDRLAINDLFVRVVRSCGMFSRTSPLGWTAIRRTRPATCLPSRRATVPA
jgi:hypothetical protein